MITALKRRTPKATESTNWSKALTQTAYSTCALQTEPLTLLLNAKSGNGQMVKGLLSRNVPIDGVGFQFHVNLGVLSELGSIEENILNYLELS